MNGAARKQSSRRGSPYITAKGAALLQAELKRLWKVDRPQVAASVQAAAGNGDRSENGDYIYGRLRLREIDRRIRYLATRLDELVVVDRLPADRSRIYFGAFVTVEHRDGSIETVRLVGSDEIDSGRRWISIDAPLGRALIGRCLDDRVRYVVDGESRSVIVKEFDYRQDDEREAD